jgi:hypothetical protein
MDGSTPFLHKRALPLLRPNLLKWLPPLRQQSRAERSSRAPLRRDPALADFIFFENGSKVLYNALKNISTMVCCTVQVK